VWSRLRTRIVSAVHRSHRSWRNFNYM
jgi:hypothetical protein